MSDITVAVDWNQSTVFAGEDIRCSITFRNAAATSRSRSPSPSSPPRAMGTGRDRWKLGLQKQPPTSNISHTHPSTRRPVQPRILSHRSTISLNAPVSPLQGNSVAAPERYEEESRKANKHNRSVSIISIGSQLESGQERGPKPPKRMHGVQKHHGRSASFQGLPLRIGTRGTNGFGSPAISNTMSPSTQRSPTAPSLLQRSSTFKHQRFRPHEHSASTKSSPSAALAHTYSSAKHPENETDYVASNIGQERPNGISAKSNSQSSSPSLNGFSQGHDTTSRDPPSNRAVQRILSPMNMEGTPRSSIDNYTQSNNSSETLASEYVSTTAHHQGLRTKHFRQASHLTPVPVTTSRTDTLMIGYVQLQGFFTLDGSLVNMAPFEAVKRKGVIGGQGSGGVVGIEHSKRDSSLFGSLGWGNIGQSLGGLLGSQEPSSLREMKGIANSKSIPLLSTPQSILFVDLKLRPGESKTFSYSHRIPPGMPPSHKGRVFKSTYQLVIGTQRAKSSDRQHTVRQVEVPFRVLPGIDGTGEILGHDLINPTIMLKDMARTQAFHERPSRLRCEEDGTGYDIASNPRDGGFATYVETLLQKSRQHSSISLLSPTDTVVSGSAEGPAAERLSIRERIDVAIFRSHSSTSQYKGGTRFQIHRDGIKVASVILTRSAYRIGETISTTVDLGSSEIPSYIVNLSLETSESVDPAIALRSGPSVHRATRRVHALRSENTVSTQKVTFDTIIPSAATPEFVTTGVRLDWRLKIEFITAASEIPGCIRSSLLEHTSEDERGNTFTAVQDLPCQSFEVTVPVRVYGSIRSLDDDKKPTSFSI